MKINLTSHVHRPARACVAAWIALIALTALGTRAGLAGLPEPDNVIFGVAVRDGVPVTAADYDVEIQVRRTPGGQPIARYWMGSNSRLGDFYAIRVKLESNPPVTDPEATQANDRVYLVVTDFNGDVSSTNLLISQRGTMQRMDLGGAASSTGNDTDFDGLPDAWELARFGTLNNGPDVVGPNGQTALFNYLTGSDPNNPDDVFRLSIAPSTPRPLVSFFAREASGPGYAGLSRLYSLEYSTNVSGGPWVLVPGRTNLPGNNTTISYSTTETPAKVIYRGQVQLIRP